MSEDRDVKFMRAALQEAQRYIGWTSPNPPVGAVLVGKDGNILVSAGHKGAGLPHAEQVILGKVRGSILEGSSLYVTLEPCSTFGRTPPCVDFIKNSGIKEVIYGIEDPNPEHTGRARGILEAAGIAVRSGVLREELTRFYRPFEVFIRQKRPFVIIKCALTLDGRIKDNQGISKWITSSSARRDAHIALRARSKAILVGIGTILADNPSLMIDASGIEERLDNSPFVRVIIDPSLKCPKDAVVVKNACRRYPLYIIVGETVSDENISHFLSEADNNYIKVIQLKQEQDVITAESILKRLAKEGVDTLIVEGGARTFTSFLNERLVDSMHLYYSTSMLGAGLPAFSFQGLSLAERVWLKDIEIRQIDEKDIVVSGYVYWDYKQHS